MRDLPSVMTLLSPLVHSELSLGTDAKLRRLRWIIDGRPVEVPVVSGNSIRGLLRRASARTVIEECGIGPQQLSVAAFDLLHSGGALEPGKGAGIDHPVDSLRRVRALLPPLGLFGGSVGSHVLPGLVDVDMALPIVRELEPWTGESSEISLWDCVQEIPYSRHDDRSDRDEQSRVQMRYSVEALVAGLRLRHGARLHTDDDVTVGCFWDAVSRVARERSVGGRGAIGHGRFTWTWQPDEPRIAAYRQHLRDHAGEIVDFLGADRLVA